MNEEKNPGVFIDIDGVVWKGGKAYDWSKAAINKLWDNKVPFVFLTNGTYSAINLVDTLKKTLDLPFTNDHVIVAPSPCHDLNEYHNKRVLVCCQDDSIGLISELGFKNAMTIAELVEIFPELDYVDHEKRKILLASEPSEEQNLKREQFQPIESILLLGEPINWECSLQILLDILMTDGDPRSKFKFIPDPHLPIIACNKDLTFKGAAALPRFGHGAFLNCLESIYLKVTNNELEYQHLMGKPYQVTYKYASNYIQKQAKNGNTINKYFIIGDNPDVDIRGANMYKEHLQSLSKSQSDLSDPLNFFSIFKPVESILVCTGVYNPQNDILFHLRTAFDEKLAVEANEAKFEKVLDAVSEPSVIQKESTDHENLSGIVSRKNSFINYFENRLNVPDQTVDTLMDAVDYILDNL